MVAKESFVHTETSFNFSALLGKYYFKLAESCDCMQKNRL